MRSRPIARPGPRRPRRGRAEGVGKPDFIIIGAMKCGTSTMHEQLARQPGIFMSEPKEPNFFSDDAQYARGVGWYRGLFAPAGPHEICGESSTHYTKLPTYPDTLARMREHVPDAKLIYMMRHPIDRLVSHYIHEWTQRVIDEPIDQAVERHPELVDYGCYAMQLEPFLSSYGDENVLPVFSERLRAAPQAELERVCRFIGHVGPVQWQELPAANVSVERMRHSALRETLRAMPGLRGLYRALVPASLREGINGFWRMRQRPELSDVRRRQLERAFDEDLRRLGQWLGVELRCANFRERASQGPHQWTDHATRMSA